jgi:hypothetical protein
MVTNFVLSVRHQILVVIRLSAHFYLKFGGPLAVSVFLIILSAAGEDHLPTVWRTAFGIGVLLPLTVFYFRLRMLTTQLFRKGAIKSISCLSLLATRSLIINLQRGSLTGLY